MSRKPAAPANPLEQSAAHDARVRERAYHLWEADGRPHGRDREYWERAETLVGMQDSGNPGQLPNPSADHAPIPPAQPIEEASIQENLGEFPGLSDENEGLQTPKARKTRAVKAEPPKAETPAAPETAPKAKAAAKAKPATPKKAAAPAAKAPADAKTASKTSLAASEPAAKPKKPKKPA